MPNAPARPDETPAERKRRQARERQRRHRASNAPPNPVEVLTEAERKSAAAEVFKEQLTPAVREAVDQEVLDGLGALVKLLPSAVAQLAKDLESKDEMIRSRAAQLALKYTVGNGAALPPRGVDGDKLVIINQLPDGFDAAPAPAAAIEGTALEEGEDQRRCEDCRLWKPTGAFSGEAPTCNDCLANRKAAALQSLRDQGIWDPKPSGTGAVQQPGESGGQVPTARPAQPAPPQPMSRETAWPGPPDPKRFSFG